MIEIDFFSFFLSFFLYQTIKLHNNNLSKSVLNIKKKTVRSVIILNLKSTLIRSSF